MCFKRKLPAVICAVLLLCMFAACGEDALPPIPDNTEAPVTVRVIVLDLNYDSIYETESVTEKSTLYELFAELDGLEVQTTASFVHAVRTIGEDGFTRTGEIANADDWSVFISIFHDIDNILLKDLSRDYDISYAEKDYYLSGVGVGQLPLYDGATYVLKLVASAW